MYELYLYLPFTACLDSFPISWSRCFFRYPIGRLSSHKQFSIYVSTVGNQMGIHTTMYGYRATTSFGYCSSTASLAVRPHCANARRIKCQADLNSFPLGELETTGTPPYYVDEDYPAGPGIIEPVYERSNWRGSESSTLENGVYVWRYALIVVHVSE